jgi:D-alanyl-D-alanine dipeptidase
MLNKIVNRFNIRTIVVCIFLTSLFTRLNAQGNIAVVKKFSAYEKAVRENALKKMVELKTFIPGVRYDLRYATTNNFMHQKLYQDGDMTFLRLPAAEALAKVQQDLNEKGLSLKIWDAYRPYSVTVKMWEPIKDDRYVADPKKGSGHNRGIAVDLTIVEINSGSELNMGTDFDNFSDTAHQDFMNLPDVILRNRSLLKNVMEKYGFTALQTEWWHFFWHDPNFELLDIPFKKFKKNLN